MSSSKEKEKEKKKSPQAASAATQARGGDLKDKHGESIKEGDTVVTKMRGGKRTGIVEEVAKEARGPSEETGGIGVNRPPKVIFKDQHGHVVAHNPQTLEHGENPTR